MKTQELKKALELVKPGLASKEMMEQATSVIFREDTVWTFNDEVAVVAPLESGITGAVLAEPLYAFLGKLKPDAEIKIETGENEFKFSSGRNRASVRMDQEIKLPLEEELGEPEEWIALPERFLDSLRQVLFSASRSGHSPILTCVHIDGAIIETCDGYRLTRCDCDLGQEFDIKMVASHLDRLHTYKPEEYGMAGNWLHFRNKEGACYYVRMVEGEYPNLDKFIEMEDTVEISFPKELEGALEWASVVTDDKVKLDQHVKVTIDKKGMTIRGEGPDGWAEESIRMKWTGEPVRFEAHPIFLKEMAKLAEKVLVSKEALKVKGKDFVHVVSRKDNDEE